MVELSLVNSHDRSRGTKWHAIDRNMQELPDASRCQLIELEVCSSKSYKSRNMDPNDDMMWPINSNLQVDYASHPLISMFSGLMCQPATWRPIELYGSLALDRLRCARKERSLRCLVRGGPFQLHELLLPNPHRPRKLPMFSGHFEEKNCLAGSILVGKGAFSGDVFFLQVRHQMPVRHWMLLAIIYHRIFQELFMTAERSPKGGCS